MVREKKKTWETVEKPHLVAVEVGVLEDARRVEERLGRLGQLCETKGNTNGAHSTDLFF